MGDQNFIDLRKTPDTVSTMISMLAQNTVHLATLLKRNQYSEEQ